MMTTISTSPTKHETVRIVLIDDDEDLRDSVRLWINQYPAYQCVGSWASVVEAMERLAWKKPQIILLDLHLGQDTTIDSISLIRSAAPDTRIIILTGDHDYFWIKKALQNGADGYLLKSSLPDIIPVAIQESMAGGTPLSGLVSRQLLDQNLPSSPATTALQSLTARERTVLSHMSDGLEYKEIATLLNISTETTRTHARNILTKLGVPNKTTAVILYLKSRA